MAKLRTAFADTERIAFQRAYWQAVAANRQSAATRGGGLAMTRPEEYVRLAEVLWERAARGQVAATADGQLVPLDGPGSAPDADEIIATAPGAPGWRRAVGGALILLGLSAVLWLGLPRFAPAAGGPAPLPSAAPTGAAATPSAAVAAPPVADSFITVNGQVLPPIHPLTLELGGQSLLVYAAPVEHDNWQVRTEAGLANWIPGARLNWSFAVYVGDDAAAGAALGGLGPGAPVALRVAWNDGSIHMLHFHVQRRQVVSRTQIELFNPAQPGLTVIVAPDAGPTRIALQGTEDPPGAATPGADTGR